MGMTIEWDGGAEPLASNSGWSAFGDWADSLDADEFRQVVHLWEHGHVRDVGGLAAELDAALSDRPPPDSHTHETAENLLRVAHAATHSDHLAVTDGTGPESGGDEWDEEAGDFDGPEPPADDAQGDSATDNSPSDGPLQSSEDPDPLALLSGAMLAHAEESLAAGDDPAPGLERLRGLADDPAALAEVLAAGGADAETVGKCWLSLVRKSWSEEDHPRGKGGVFISKDKLEAAKDDPKVAAKLRKEVRPEDAGKLEKVISGEKSPGRTKRGQAAHEAAGRRTTREEGKAKTAALLSHLKRVGDLKAKLTADHLHDLADHLQSGHPTVEDVRAMRKALAGAGQGLASFGGAKRKEAMVAALVAHAKGKAFDARVKEQGFDPEEMRAALAPTPEPAAAGAEPPAVEPTLMELETGVRPGGGRRAQFQDPMSRPYRREEDAGGDDARRGSAGVGRPAHGAGVAPGGVPAGGVERLGGGDAGVGGGRGSEADGSKSPLVQDFAHSPPIPANSPPIPANSGADAKRDEGYRKWLQANGYDPKLADGPHPREKGYNASIVEGRDGGWVTPYDKGTYWSKQQAMAAARRALSDYAPRKPATAKPEPPRAAEVRQEATAAAAEQQASGRIAKQNHERTLAEFTAREGAMWGGPEKAAAVHRRIVEGSLAKGEAVPPEVLADYPDLAPRPARPAGADDARPTAGEFAAASTPAAKVGADSPPIPALSEPAPESPKPPRVLTPAEARAAGDWEGHEVRRGDLAAARGSESHGIGPKNKPGIVYPGDTLNVASRGKKAWVAKLGGKDKKYGRQREFLDGKVSRSGMNKQIVKHTFVLDEPGEYEVGGDEFGDYRHAFTVSDPADRHRAIVEAKLEAGGAVHPDVLADYPDLAKKYGPAAPLAPAGESAAASTPAGRVGAPASPPPAPAKPARAAKKPKAAPARPAWVAADPAASAALDAHAAAPGRAKDVIGNALANAGVLGTDRDGNPTGPAAEPPESDSGRTPAQELAGALAAGHRDQHDLGHSDEEREATASLLRELGAVQVGEVGGSARFDGAVHDGPPGAFTGHALTVTRPGWKIPLGGGRWWVPVKARAGRPGGAQNPPTNVAAGLPAAPSRFGQAGDDHPLAALPDRRAKLDALSDIIGRMDGSADPSRIGDPSVPPPHFSDALRDDILGVMARKQAEISVPADIAETYAAVGAKHGLTKHDFQRVLAHMDDRGDLRLQDWPRSVDDVPDPEMPFALPGDSSQALRYNVRLPANSIADIELMARLGDQSLRAASPK